MKREAVVFEPPRIVLGDCEERRYSDPQLEDREALREYRAGLEELVKEIRLDMDMVHEKICNMGDTSLEVLAHVDPHQPKERNIT